MRISTNQQGEHMKCVLFKTSFLFFLLLVLNTQMFGQQPIKSVDWNAWKFLLGEWVGGGDGDPGKGTGGFTFSFDLQNTILVRKNFAHYPALNNRPAFTHEDLMIIYYQNSSSEAIYFDNEKHIIHYKIEFSKDSSTLIFLSDVEPRAPRFRLTYAKMGDENLGITFEIAQPDKPGAFSKYIEAFAQRKK
jgi:hypothetical protein